MGKEKKFISAKTASNLLKEISDEFIILKNPEYVYPPLEIQPLAPKISKPVDHLVAAVMDMDGTTTTTENLCIHSLEYMVRQITKRPDKTMWEGLDPIEDYPNVIGNSTTKHVEYLIDRYKNGIKKNEFKKAYIGAAIWFLLFGKDPDRVKEVRLNLKNLGCESLLNDAELQKLIELSKSGQNINQSKIDSILAVYEKQVSIIQKIDQVRAGIDIYYQRYHEILEAIKQGDGNRIVSDYLGSNTTGHLIEPMAGIGIFIALIKGWLGEGAAKLYPNLYSQLEEKLPEIAAGIEEHKTKMKLENLGRHFEINPLKIAIVTSSIKYEAEIVLGEVFRVLKERIQDWPVSKDRKLFLLEKFSDYQNIYDGFVTATDSSEIRLKPHRDLYSLALHQLGVPKEQFSAVMGFEDSESGTIAIRTAGIGLCLAVPFSETQHHDFEAASFVLHGGLPEAIFRYNSFLKIN